MKFLLLLSMQCLCIALLEAQPETGNYAYKLKEQHLAEPVKLAEQVLRQYQPDSDKRNESTLDSVKFFNWDEVSLAWELSGTDYYHYGFDWDTIYSYDKDQSLNSRIIINYEGNGNVTDYRFDAWDGSNWIPNYRVLYYFTPDGILTGYTIYLGNVGVLENYLSVSYVFDNNDVLVERYEERWNQGAWESYRLATYTNNADGLPVTEYIQQWAGVWDPYSQYTYSYGANKELLSSTYEFWDGGWDPRNRIDYVYNAQLQLTNNILSDYESGSWIPQSQTIYEYDGSGNTILELYQDSDGAGWYDVERDIYGYDAENNQISYVNQFWDEAWINFDSSHYYRSIISAIYSVDKNAALSVYPNPATDKLHWITAGLHDVVEFNIYNLSGQLIQTVVPGLKADLVDVSWLGAGIYIAEVRMKDSLARSLFVKN